jgi:2'-5' RNA ligase
MPARLFVALDLPPEAARAVAGLCTELPAARWSDPAQFHLTLRFMAAVPDDDVARVGDRLAEIHLAPFRLALRGVGVFPGGRRPPRVLWAGLAPPEPLVALKAAIDQALGPETCRGAGGSAAAAPSRGVRDPSRVLDDQEAARSFRPHLTLARFREPPGPALPRYLARHQGFTTEPWTADAFLLYRSTLGPHGATHQVLRRYSL